jgi:hypothetical protein
MTLLADLSDSLMFGWMLIVSILIPSVGLIVSGATLRKRGLNRWCGFATVVFFFALLTDSILWSLGERGAGSPKWILYFLLGSCAIHALSALMALRGLVQVRQRRKWAHGRRRGMWIFWLNVGVILAIGVWCYVHVNDSLYERLMK